MCVHYCEVCRRDAELLTIKEAAHAAGTCPRTMHSWIKKGHLHLMQDAGGHTLICKRSLIGTYTKDR